MSEEPNPLHDLHKHLRPIGVHQGPQSFPQHLINTRKRQFSQAASLHDLTKEFAFFTPALLYELVPNAPDLTASFIEETKKETVPFSIAFDKPLFNGLHTWDNVLYGMERKYWPEYLAFIGTIALLNREKQQLWRVRTQTIDILDPFATAVSASLPLVEITAFWLESSHGSWYLHSGYMIPHAKFDNRVINPDTLRFTNKILSEGNDPYGVQDADNYPPPLGG